MKRIVTIVGARPQFIKAAALSRRLADFPGLEEQIVHTGQHYDDNMSDVFFRELGIPAPVLNLGAGGGSQASQTGAIMAGLEQAFAQLRPDMVLVYGDTNSTLAAALVAAKMPLPLAHVEAGLRSFRPGMPEEVNRVVTDRLSDWLFCPTKTACANLLAEGRQDGVHQVGDIMYDCFLHQRRQTDDTAVLASLGLARKSFVLMTLHRAENTDDVSRLAALVEGVGRVSAKVPVVLPLHPRTRGALDRAGLSLHAGIRVIAPQPHGVTLALAANACAVATDSGGLQKEAFFAATPCVTLRDETEWVETLADGWNRLVGPNADDVELALGAAMSLSAAEPPPVFGDGDAAGRILSVLGGS